MVLQREMTDTSNHVVQFDDLNVVARSLWREYEEKMQQLSARFIRQDLPDLPTSYKYIMDSLERNMFPGKSGDWVYATGHVGDVRRTFTGDNDSITCQKHLIQRLLARWLAESKKEDEITTLLRLQGLDAVADRVSYLQHVVADDPDEPPIELESLRYLAQFLIRESELTLPRIGVSPDGILQIEWLLVDDGIVAMWFLVDGNIEFAAVAGKIQTGNQRERVSGILRKDKIMQALWPFASELMHE